MRIQLILFSFVVISIFAQSSLKGQEKGNSTIIIYSDPGDINVKIPKINLDLKKYKYKELLLSKVPEGEFKFIFNYLNYKLKYSYRLLPNDTLTIYVNFIRDEVFGATIEELENLDDENEYKIYIANSLRRSYHREVEDSKVASNSVSDIEELSDKDFLLEEEFKDEKVFYIVEEMPLFNGGHPATEFRKFIAQNLRYPDHAAENKISGRVIVQFAIDSEGKLVDPVVVAGVDPSLDQEAIRVVSLSPPWTPGRQRGVTVKVLFTFPINFTL